MPSLANDPDGEAVCSGKAFPFVDSNLSHRKEGKNMGPEDRIHFGIFQNAFFHHHPSAASTFFSRLEDPLDVSS